MYVFSYHCRPSPGHIVCTYNGVHIPLKNVPAEVLADVLYNIGGLINNGMWKVMG